MPRTSLPQVTMTSSNNSGFAKSVALGIFVVVINCVCLEGLASESGGFVVAWGDNSSGAVNGFPSQDQKAVGSIAKGGKLLEEVSGIAAGSAHCMALLSNGTVAGWGAGPYQQSLLVDGRELTNVIAIAAAGTHSLALNADGTVTAWGGKGTGSYGEADVPPGLSNVIAIAAGWNRTLVLKRDGTVVGWGTRAAPRGLSNITAIAATDMDFGYDLALQKDGSVVQWERNGKLLPGPAEAAPAIAIAAGASQSLALRRDGAVVEWRNVLTGTMIHPEITSMHPGLSNVVAIASAQMRNLALKSDGTVVAWGFMNSPVPVPNGLSNVVAIATAQTFSLAITTNKAVADRFSRF